ncbi:MAG TPA: hypothetical protein VKT78_07750 [Fimbriimonadaceae bacterium]|nr:hypothetical protein [Fimbriimonadaceae bacterium]
MTWFRIARRVAGGSALPEHAALETLIQAEGEKPHNDYRIAAYVVPAVVATLTGLVGLIVVVENGWRNWPVFLPCAALAAGLWALFYHLDRRIPESLRKVRRLSDRIGHRYAKFTSLVGVQPAISPRVAEVLDEAAAIYLKHRPLTVKGSRKIDAGPFGRARQALEDAMGRMLELAEPDTPLAQEVALDQGWALPLLQEMRTAAMTLDQFEGSLESGGLDRNDPLSNLREARRELQGIEAALGELEIRQK